MTRHPVITVLMVVAGVILLLPGLCALIFMSSSMGGDSQIMLLWLLCLAISAGGVALIVRAFR
jgi:hypothetical protein